MARRRRRRHTYPLNPWNYYIAFGMMFLVFILVFFVIDWGQVIALTLGALSLGVKAGSNVLRNNTDDGWISGD